MTTSKLATAGLVLLCLFGWYSAPGQSQGAEQISSYGNVSLLLVGHGGPATDFPKLQEYFRLHGKNTDEARAIEKEMARWPRNEENDSYWAGFMRILHTVEQSGLFRRVHYAFNEMCSPTVEEALEEVKKGGADTVVVTSIMLTSGGVHSEKDIPLSIQNFRDENPGIIVIYAWPYTEQGIASFLTDHVGRFLTSK